MQIRALSPLWLVTAWFLITGVGHAQHYAMVLPENPRMEVCLLRQVLGDSMLVCDLQIRRLRGEPVQLGGSTFSLQTSAGGLNLVAATKDPALDGPWDSDTDPTAYNDVAYVYNQVEKTFTISIVPIVEAPAGVVVPDTLTRIARVVIPIVDPANFNEMLWRTEVNTVLDFDLDEANSNFFEWTDSIRFLVQDAEAPLPLCNTPPTPRLMQTTAIALCRGDSVTLRSSYAGQNQWYRGAELIATTAGDSLRVAEAGRYTVTAKSFVCLTTSPDTLSVQVLPNEAPTISQDGDDLVTNAEPALQWQLNGADIPEATSPRFTPTESGNYRVVMTNACGTFTSAEFAFVLTSNEDPDPLPSIVSLSAWPNPYTESTRVRVQLPTACHVQLRVLNLGGQELRKLMDDDQRAGTYIIELGGRSSGLVPGNLLVELIAGKERRALKLVLAE